MRLERPALLVHAFATVDQAAVGATCLPRLWAACGALGMDQPVQGFPQQPDLRALEAGVLDERVTVLAGRRAALPSGSGVQQAIMYRREDVVGLMVMQAPNDGTGWAELHRRWSAAAGVAASDGLLGSAMVHIGHVTGDRLSSTCQPDAELGQLDPTELARDVLRPHVPEPGDEAWVAAWARNRQPEYVVWELPPASSAGPRHRRLMVVAPLQGEARLEAWVWARQGPGLVPLTGYLLDAARIRDQRTLVLDELPRIHGLAEDVDTTTDTVLAHVATLADRGYQSVGQRAASLQDLRSAGARLVHLSGVSDGLLRLLGALDEVSRTVRYAAVRAAASVGEVEEQRPGSTFRTDADLARTVAQLAEESAARLRAVQARATEAARAGETTVDNYLRDRQAEISLVQTSVLGGLLTALAAIQSLEYKLPVAPGLQAPLIAAFGSLGASLPILLPYWALAGVGSTRRSRLAPLAATATTGASFGWLAATLAAVASGKDVAVVGVSISWGVVGAALALVALALRDRVMRRRPHRRAGPPT